MQRHFFFLHLTQIFSEGVSKIKPPDYGGETNVPEKKHLEIDWERAANFLQKETWETA